MCFNMYTSEYWMYECNNFLIYHLLEMRDKTIKLLREGYETVVWQSGEMISYIHLAAFIKYELPKRTDVTRPFIRSIWSGHQRPTD